MWDYNKYIDPSYKNYSRTRRRISPARLFKILEASEDLHDGERAWIFQQCYEVSKSDAMEMFVQCIKIPIKAEYK